MPKSESLIINSPYSPPSRHWQFTGEGEPLELADGRRKAGYMIADPKAKPPLGKATQGLRVLDI